MLNNEVIFLLLICLFIACKVAHYYYKKYKINYSNYQMALRALADLDPELEKYLIKKEMEMKSSNKKVQTF